MTLALRSACGSVNAVSTAKLAVVATPIGNLSDLSARAKPTLLAAIALMTVGSVTFALAD